MLPNNPWFPTASGLGVRTLNCIAGGIEVSTVPGHGGHALLFGMDEGDLETCLAWEGLLMYSKHLGPSKTAFPAC